MLKILGGAGVTGGLAWLLQPLLKSKVRGIEDRKKITIYATVVGALIGILVILFEDEFVLDNKGDFGEEDEDEFDDELIDFDLED